MASVKISKEKPGPRLVPRPTTTSAARAARAAHAATNRRPPSTPRQSPMRPASSRNTPASAAKAEVKKSLVPDEDIDKIVDTDSEQKCNNLNNQEEVTADSNDNEEKNPDALEYCGFDAPNSASIVQAPKSRPTSPAQQHSPAVILNCDADLRGVYCTKQNEFHQLKKELDLKQQNVLEVFDTLRHIQERMKRDGFEVQECVSQDLIIFNVGDWTTEEITQLCRDAQGSAGDRPSIYSNTFDDTTLASLESDAVRVPEHLAGLCLRALTTRQDVIDWMKDLAERNEIPNDATRERVLQYNEEGLQLFGVLEEIKVKSKNTMDSFTSLTRRFCQERSTLLRVQESLLRELATLKQEADSRNNAQGDTVCQETRRDLERERAVKSELKEKLATAETQVRCARARIAQMDKQLKESEASIVDLTGTVKFIQDKSRQKEIAFEARARKLKESLKTGEVTINQLIQDRNVLQSELNELKENIKIKENQYMSQIEELNEKLEEASRNHEREVMDLTRNEELLKRLTEKDQLLEQQEVKLRSQAQAIKDRDELISMLKNKESEKSSQLQALQQDLEHRMKIVDEVNKQIAAKASEIQKLFSTLEYKQQQTHRLERIVVALEEQQRRSQAQRTRYEDKIATLERELAESMQKERKFHFF